MVGQEVRGIQRQLRMERYPPGSPREITQGEREQQVHSTDLMRVILIQNALELVNFDEDNGMQTLRHY